jgi:3-oxoacyl-[acyl-carrier protein] reductase
MLEDKVAVITGGSRGIGRAIALEFAACGAHVAIIYSENDEAATETVGQAGSFDVKAKAYRCDVRSFEETKKTVSDILADFGRADVLVNNAGITRDALVVSMSEEKFDDVLGTNLKGAFNMIRHLYRHMMKRRTGTIINVSSVSGLMGNAGQANYSSAKAGMIGLTKTVARELASRNVTCNAIAPGFIETDMTAKLSEKVDKAALDNIPLGRFGKAEEVAKLAAFLASDNARYITGEVIRIDGGVGM